MVFLELGDAQAQLLHKILTTYLGDLRMEIAGTERKAYRDALHSEEDLIKDLLVRLQEQRFVNESLEIPGLL